MDQSDGEDRFDAIERRQRLTLALLTGLYLLGGLWLLVTEVAGLGVWHAGVGAVALVVCASVLGVYRRRRAR